MPLPPQNSTTFIAANGTSTSRATLAASVRRRRGGSVADGAGGQLGERPRRNRCQSCASAPTATTSRSGAGARSCGCSPSVPAAHVRWVVLSATTRREREARASAADFLADAERGRRRGVPTSARATSRTLGDRDQGLLQRAAPPRRARPRPVPPPPSTSTRTTARSPSWCGTRSATISIAEYEIPKYEGDLGHPNLFVDLPVEVAERKIELLMKHFGTQRDKYWFRPETFAGLMAAARRRGRGDRMPRRSTCASW